MPIRAGTDIAFLGGLVNHVLSGGHDFREYVVAYTNAATILREDFRDTEDLDGLFSGFDPEIGPLRPDQLAVRRHRGHVRSCRRPAGRAHQRRSGHRQQGVGPR